MNFGVGVVDVLGEKKSRSSALVATAVAFGCLTVLGSGIAHAQEKPTVKGSLARGGVFAMEGGLTESRSALESDVTVDPVATVVKVSVPGFDGRDVLLDVAARASAANQLKFQRSFFLSAEMRF